MRQEYRAVGWNRGLQALIAIALAAIFAACSGGEYAADAEAALEQFDRMFAHYDSRVSSGVTPALATERIEELNFEVKQFLDKYKGKPEEERPSYQKIDSAYRDFQVVTLTLLNPELGEHEEGIKFLYNAEDSIEEAREHLSKGE